MNTIRHGSSILMLVAIIGMSPPGDTDNSLSAEEKAAGWVLLFDGKTLDGWKTDRGEAGKTPVQNGAINPHKAGGYMLVPDRILGDFVLSLDFKISPGCNSGVFVRTFPLTPRPGLDVGFNGIEIAIDDSKTAGYHDTGAVYDLVRPTENAMKAVGQWNHLVVTCNGPKIAVELNGKGVSRMDLDEWTTPNRRPDGSAHKFDVAYKSHPRQGYIGLQDHGSACWFKNIKLLSLPKTGGK